MAEVLPVVMGAGKQRVMKTGDAINVNKLTPLPSTTGKQYTLVPGAGNTFTWQELASATTMRLEPIDATSAGQTSFTVPGGYTPGVIDVYRGGSLLDSSEYTATNGTTVVLNVGAVDVGERIAVKVYSTLLITNALSVTGTAADSSKLGGQLPAYYATETARAAITQRLHLQHQEPSGTQGGTPVVGQNVRKLNTVLTNTIPGASLNTTTNEFTLPAGTFEFDIVAQMAGTVASRAFLRNSGGGSILIIGSNAYPGTSSANPCLVKGVLTFATATTVQVSCYSPSSGANQFGNATGIAGVNEVYVDVMVRRLA